MPTWALECQKFFVLCQAVAKADLETKLKQSFNDRRMIRWTDRRWSTVKFNGEVV